MNDTQNAQFSTRPVQPTDADELTTLLNEIIEIGGSTAYQKPLTEKEFAAKFISAANNVSCFVAESSDDRVIGFQWLTRNENLPESWGDIATFAKANSGVRGIGSALFKDTQTAAQNAGLDTINATIRGDNVSGLGYYSKMGFVDYNVIKDVPLSDGTLVDRVQKKHSLV